MLDQTLQIDATHVVDTFAEAFGMRYARLIVTAHDQHWLQAAIGEFTGYASSVIACDLEIGVEQWLSTAETPDGRCGAAVLAFGFSAEALASALPQRAGQCLMTCPTTAVFDGLPQAEKRIPLGKHIRFFGDGYQKSKVINERRYWRIPVMDGEFVVEESLGVAKGVGGGNLIVQTAALSSALEAARRGIDAIAAMPGVITPFPGGVARSGSKVGSRYKKLKASTADAFCPTLRGRVASSLWPEANAALEIVIDGIDESAVTSAMQAAIHAVVGSDVLAITAGNYGGQLGPYHFHLHQLLNDRARLCDSRRDKSESRNPKSETNSNSPNSHERN